MQVRRLNLVLVLFKINELPDRLEEPFRLELAAKHERVNVSTNLVNVQMEHSLTSMDCSPEEQYHNRSDN